MAVALTALGPLPHGRGSDHTVAALIKTITALIWARLRFSRSRAQRLNGCDAPYVNERHSHSAGPKRNARNHKGDNTS